MRLFCVWNLVFFLGFTPFPSGLASAAPIRVSEVVGALTGHVVTSREVAMSGIMDQAMSSPKAFRPLPARGSKDFKENVAQVLLECMVSAESDSFGVGGASAQDISGWDSKLAEYLARHGAAMSLWKSLEVSSKEKEKILRRKIQTEKFIEFKTRSSAVPVTDEEARDYFLKNKIRFGNAPFQQFRENIKTYLEKRNSETRLSEWFDLLQRKYNVRNFVADRSS